MHRELFYNKPNTTTNDRKKSNNNSKNNNIKINSDLIDLDNAQDLVSLQHPQR